MPRPLFTPGREPVLIVQEAGWAPGPVWTGAENLAPTVIRSPDRPACSQSLYRLRYPTHLEMLGPTQTGSSQITEVPGSRLHEIKDFNLSILDLRSSGSLRKIELQLPSTFRDNALGPSSRVQQSKQKNGITQVGIYIPACLSVIPYCQASSEYLSSGLITVLFVFLTDVIRKIMNYLFTLFSIPLCRCLTLR